MLLFAHRELEKLVLSKEQLRWKDALGAFYGELVHEARYHDPVARDVEAFLTSSQREVMSEAQTALGVETSNLRFK